MNTIKFKIDRPTGKRKAFSSPTYYVIINKIDVGTISHKSNLDRSDRLEVGVSFRVLKDDILEDGNSNCVWRNLTLKARFNTAQEMKDFLTKNLDKIVSSLKLYDTEENKLI